LSAFSGERQGGDTSQGGCNDQVTDAHEFLLG
jgi:hypothetical protein